MENLNSRSFSCKDEELPVICGLVVSNYRRDSSDFEVHSTMYNEAFIKDFETETSSVLELVDPQSETLMRRVITERGHATISRQD